MEAGRPSAASSASAAARPSANGPTNPGWSKYCRIRWISRSSSSPVSASDRARSSRYWRHPEYDEYALVTNASTRRWPSAWRRAISGVRYGSQFRLPQ